ncbi:hypothetical protein D9M71_741660 [compost metagenome]
MATDQVRGGAASAFTRSGVLQRGHYFELLRQAQVIVAAEADQRAAVDLQAHAITPANRAPGADAALGKPQLALVLDAFVEVRTGHGGGSWSGGRLAYPVARQNSCDGAGVA